MHHFTPHGANPIIALEAQPGCCQHHAPTFHPAITAADRATMSVRELAFFTDDPVAHAVAYRDYIRARQIETRNAEIAEYLEHRRNHLLARFFAEDSRVVQALTAGENS